MILWQTDLGVATDGAVLLGEVVFLPGAQKIVAHASASSAGGAAAVERWQSAVGLEVDGLVRLGEVVFFPGGQRVVAHASAGAAGSASTVSVGSTVQPGNEIMRVAPPTNAPDPGQDILQLEENLVALGYDLDGTIAVDLEFDAATEASVKRWQRAAGLDPDGIVELGDVVFRLMTARCRRVTGPSSMGLSRFGHSLTEPNRLRYAFEQLDDGRPVLGLTEP